MTELPKSVRIGYRTYAVEVLSSRGAMARDVYGECDNCLAQIRIWCELDGPKSANTMIHELLHACWYVAGLENDDKQERTVTVLANQLTQVFRDNPQLVEWINERLSNA